MGPCPRNDRRWRSYSPKQEFQDRWSSIREKKYINLSHQPGEDSHVISVLVDLLSTDKRL